MASDRGGWIGHGWEGYYARVRQHLDWDTLEKDEIDYKKDTERLLRKVRGSVLAGRDDWPNDIKTYRVDWPKNHSNPLAALIGCLANLCSPMSYIKLIGWFDKKPDAASEALRSLWRVDDPSSGRRPTREQVIARIRDFSSQLPKDVIRGVGTRLRVIAALHLAMDADNYPPFMTTVFDHAFDLTGYTDPPEDLGEGALYEYVLTFLDRAIKEAPKWGLGWPRNRLEAQSMVYALWDRLKEE